MNQLTAYTLRLGDNYLVLSQRLGNGAVTHRTGNRSRTGKHSAPDLLGQARNFSIVCR